MNDNKNNVPSSRTKWIILYIIITSIFLVSGYYYYNYEKSDLIKQKENELRSIAKLKIDQISNWYLDEIEDVEIISHNTILIAEIRKTLAKTDTTAQESLIEYLNMIKKQHNYAEIFITDENANVIAATNPTIKLLNGILREKFNDALIENKNTEIDFFRSAALGNKILLGFAAPIPLELPNDELIITFLIDPKENIYPLTESWPVPSMSSETFLFKVESDSIVYLNNLRHRKETALEFRLPKSLKDLPAVKAAEGYKGLFRGKDYRGENVIAYLSDIPGTNWFLIAKVDEEELFTGLVAKMEMVGIIVLLLMISTGIGLYTIYATNQHKLSESLYEKDKELWQQSEKFKVTMDSLGQGVLTLDVSGKVQYMNKMAEDLTGWSLRNARGRDLHEVYPVINEKTGKRENNILDKIFKYGVVKELANHTILITREGKEIPVMDTGAPVYDTDGSIIGVSIVFQDETERREIERKIKESEERFRSTLDDLVEGCQIIGFDYKYLYLNKAAIESSRMKSEELVGKTMMECYPGIENTEMFRRLETSMEKRIPANFENVFTYPDGGKKIFNLRFEPVAEGLFILSEDITEFKTAQEIIKKFRAGIELSGDAIFITDNEGIITYVNPAFEKVFGFTSEEAVGKTPRILKSGVLDQDYYENFWNRIKSNKPVIHEIINKTKNNRLIHVEASISPINNDTGEIIGYLAIERDVTSRKVAEEKRKQLTAILEATPDFVAIADRNGKSIFLNRAGKKLLGLEEDVDIATLTIERSHPKWAGDIVLTQGLPTAAKKGIWYGETALLHKDGHETPISQLIIAHKSDKGEVEYFSTIGRDITERKRFEKELIEAKEKAEEMNKVKTIFFANMSHELRTPFVGIMGYAELLFDELEDPDHKEMAEGIISTSKRMMETLTKILKLTRLEMHDEDIELEEIEIHEIIGTAYNNFLPAAKKKDLVLEKSISDNITSITTDKTILLDILANLLHNAINYTNEGKVSLIAERVPAEGKEFCCIKVKDTGIGIPEDKKDIVWMEFRQASEGRTREFQGTGLGLAIVKKNTEMLGGKIWFESVEGEGTTFTLLLPLD